MNGPWNTLGLTIVCTPLFPCQIGPASENGRTDVHKHAWFCFSFWDQLSGINGDGWTIICDTNLSLLLLLSHLAVMESDGARLNLYKEKCKRVRGKVWETLLLSPGLETPASTHYISVSREVSHSICTLPPERWRSCREGLKTVAAASSGRWRPKDLRSPAPHGLQHRR